MCEYRNISSFQFYFYKATDAKLRTGKFRSGMEFTFCTNQLHFPKNGRKGLKLVSTMALKKWNTNFPFEHSDWTNKTTLPDVPLLLLEIFRCNDPWNRDPFTFLPNFSGNFYVSGKKLLVSTCNYKIDY